METTLIFVGVTAAAIWIVAGVQHLRWATLRLLEQRDARVNAAVRDVVRDLDQRIVGDRKKKAAGGKLTETDREALARAVELDIKSHGVGLGVRRVRNRRVLRSKVEAAVGDLKREGARDAQG